MSADQIPHPEISTREEWPAARLKLLTHEKELTRHKDRVNAERRRLPMVLIDKDYQFEGPDGKLSLEELFEVRRQLIVYHFMFDPDWEKGCPGCTWFVNAIGNISALKSSDATFVLVARAPYAKLAAYKDQKGWTIPWFSSFGSDFNYDFHVTNDERIRPVEYNYLDKAGVLATSVPLCIDGEEHGLSVFFRLDGYAYHTYSTYARGTEGLTDAFGLLDTTPFGRQEDFEDSPPGWPQGPTYG